MPYPWRERNEVHRMHLAMRRVMAIDVADSEDLPTVEEAAATLAALEDNISGVLLGKEQVVRWTIASVVAGGHVLLEDVPGVGKTTLALAMAKSLGLSFRRIQFTSDLLPGDIVGVSVYAADTGDFSFRPGPIFAGLVLADEINRTTPRTQSALLEAMSEGSVSVDDETRALPEPFIVIATQNPLDHHGTYPLPESQLDRFLIRLGVGYPERSVERSILMQRRLAEPVDELEPVMAADELASLQQVAASVVVEESVVDLVLAVVEATRADARVRIGVSPRGALAVIRMVRAVALMNGRDYAIPDDAIAVFVPCLAHRLSLASGHQDRAASEGIIESILADIDIPV